MQPLSGIRVLDFTTLLPGPLATLMLAEAGAEVIKIERPGVGDEMRAYQPRLGRDSVNFALLNRGKRSVALDLKDRRQRERLWPLIDSADVLVEQFRPGVMARLGLDYERLRRRNPRLVYCSITGYGQEGPSRDVAGHDLNYLAETGLLGLAADRAGAPVVPPALIADIAAGSYPAVVNIQLALLERARTGSGCLLDVAMTDNLFPFLYWALGTAHVTGRWPRPGGELVTGGSPRYAIYRTRDGRYLAAAPLEQRFWDVFCGVIGLDAALREDAADPAATMAAVAGRIGSDTAARWRERFAGKNACCTVVATLEEALAAPHFRARGLFDWSLAASDRRVPALPVPLARRFRAAPGAAGYPALGADNALLAPEEAP
ncbi:MAG: CoA transferase [Candidatus Lambdaproteobacteria bacterium]|nr:CoA transferase [Candidatus Lambdaproteobacteria bacterium]